MVFGNVAQVVECESSIKASDFEQVHVLCCCNWVCICVVCCTVGWMGSSEDQALPSDRLAPLFSFTAVRKCLQSGTRWLVASGRSGCI